LEKIKFKRELINSGGRWRTKTGPVSEGIWGEKCVFAWLTGG